MATPYLVGAAARCDLLILFFTVLKITEDQKIAACRSSYMRCVFFGVYSTQL